MTFTMRIKNEITNLDTNVIEALTELNTFIKYNATITNQEIILYVENASVARRMYKLIKQAYAIQIKLTIRQQKKFNKTTIYILELREKISEIIKNLDNDNLDSDEEKISFLRGAFLASGSINDPKTNRYHAEFLVKKRSEANIINKILNGFSLHSKILKREKGYMIYLKVSEEISDLIKMFGAVNSLFYYEDIRIYKDHKNMVNRLNNCEQANVEKLLKTAGEQIKNIEYLMDNDLYILLDDKTKIICDYRLKYKESSYQELADIISLETNYKITKSGINHHFRKINELMRKHQNS